MTPTLTTIAAGLDKVAGKLEHIALNLESRGETIDLDLTVSSITFNAQTRTTCGCIAGLYLLEDSQTCYKETGPGTYRLIDANLPDLYLSFACGMEKIARDAGFNEVQDLKLWAMQHPELWGNDFGWYLFIKTSAWSTNGKPSIHDVTGHLRAVAGRCRAQTEPDTIQTN